MPASGIAHVVSPVLSSPLTTQDRVVLISHSCDICHQNPEGEPLFEVLPARFVGESGLKKDMLRGKAPRHLQLRISSPEEALYQLNIIERRFIPRDFLESNAASGFSVKSEHMQELRRWLRRRYDRTVLPTAFNLRVNAALKVLQKEVRKSGESITRVLVRVHPHVELPAGQKYELALLLTIPSADWNDKSAREALLDAQVTLTQAFSAIPGVDLIAMDIISEGDLVVETLSQFDRWDYLDYLSPADDPSQLDT